MKLKKLAYDLIRATPPLQGALRRRELESRRAFPKILGVELTNACNAHCIMCPRDAMSRKIELMKWPLYEKIIEEANAHQDRLTMFQPFNYGESLCHPEFLPMLRFARQRLPRVRVNLATNAQLLTEEVAAEILDIGIDSINFDIDGATKETYEAVRERLNFETVEANVNRFLELRSARKLDRPRVSVTMIEMDKTTDEVEEFRRRWSGKADRVQINQYNTWLGHVPDRNVREARESSSTTDFSFPCNHLWTELVISVDGRVTICCLDFDFKHTVGTLEDSTILDLWTGPALDEVRKTFIEGRYKELPLCRDCNAHIFQRGKYWEALWPRIEPIEPESDHEQVPFAV